MLFVGELSIYVASTPISVESAMFPFRLKVSDTHDCWWRYQIEIYESATYWLNSHVFLLLDSQMAQVWNIPILVYNHSHNLQ